MAEKLVRLSDVEYYLLQTAKNMLDEARALADNACRMPVVDAVPVVHARWDDTYHGITPVCSACKRIHRCLQRKPLYCPNCGAKMDGGADNA